MDDEEGILRQYMTSKLDMEEDKHSQPVASWYSCPVLRMREGVLDQYVTSQLCLVVVRMGEHIVNQSVDRGKILNTD